MNYLMIAIKNKTDFDLVKQFIETSLPLLEDEKIDRIKDNFFEMDGTFSLYQVGLNAIMLSRDYLSLKFFINDDSQFHGSYGPNVRRVDATELKEHYDWLEDLSLHPDKDKVVYLLKTIINGDDVTERMNAYNDLRDLVDHNNTRTETELIKKFLEKTLYNDDSSLRPNVSTFKPVLMMFVCGKWVE